jgi:two-component system sensor histidine kinase DegS
MSSDKQDQQQINRLIVSIRLYRSIRRQQTENKLQERRVSEEIDQLVRQKVVRQLHDGLSQTVSALAMRVNFARRMMDSDPQAAQEELEKVEELARDTTREIRHLIFILRPIPPDSFELIKSFELLTEKLQELFNLQIELKIDENILTQLPMIDQRIIYTLVEETIDSARKRNGCSRLVVRLERFEKQAALLEIEDGGYSSKQIEYPFQVSELETIQEISELIDASIRVLDGGTKIQILFPFPEQVEG